MNLLSLPTMGKLLLDVTTIHVTQAVTGTATVAAPTAGPATATPGTLVNPPVPPSAIQQQPMAGNPFSMDYLTSAAQPGFGPFSLLYLLLSLGVLGGGIYLYFFGKKRWHRVHKLNYRLANFWGLTAMILGGFALLFYLFRILSIDGLNMRFWPYLMVLLILGFAVYAYIYFRTQYPAELAKQQQSQKAKAIRPERAARAVTRPAKPASSAGAPARPTGSPGNPRGTSTRGERRREKK